MATYRALLSLKSSLNDPDSRLSALSALRLLNLSNNLFNRTFPPELSNLTNLCVLDLYNNNLTGVFLQFSLIQKLFDGNLYQSSLISFQIPRFDASDANIVYEGDALPAVGVVELINKFKYICRVGRATHVERIPIWNSRTWKVADFSTRFSFVIQREYGSDYGSGIAFFLAPYGYQIPPNSAGGFLGLLNTTTSDYAGTQIVIVEFDSYVNVEWDPPYEHVGINRNSISSVAKTPWNISLHDGDIVDVWITYTAATTTLDVHWSYQNTPATAEETTSLTYQIDLAKVQPEWATVGFSSGTRDDGIRNQILSWDFNSTLERKYPGPGLAKGTKNTLIIIAVPVSVGSLILGMFVAHLYWKYKKKNNKVDTVPESVPGVGDQDMYPVTTYDSEMGSIPYPVVQTAADSGRMLGQGTSGTVYKCNLTTDLDTAVAVKKISNRSGQGRMEYMTEVRLFSSLRHPNLVQLKGWCHDKDETTFLLVYEFMPNGSLDTHLSGKGIALTWDDRYKISEGLATALLYLHDPYLHKGWNQCVVHRDIKSSNILLDASLNVKLGDFGRALKESDVYSFVVVILEIATGRSVNHMGKDSEMGLVEWVWDLYGIEKLLSAVDKTLPKYDEKQAVCLMTVGLLYAHPDPNARPSIREAIQFLHFDADLPNLPKTMPVRVYEQLTPQPSVNSDVEASSTAGTVLKMVVELIPAGLQVRPGLLKSKLMS
ncbi:hypothetical protein ACLB2K_003964 [Fragaria x ananassa]